MVINWSTSLMALSRHCVITRNRLIGRSATLLEKGVGVVGLTWPLAKGARIMESWASTWLRSPDERLAASSSIASETSTVGPFMSLLLKVLCSRPKGSKIA